MKNFLSYVALFSRFILGLMFIYSSISKIADTAAFASAIDNYHILPYGIENIFAIVLPWLELIIGICLLSGIFVDGAALLAILLILMFIFAVSFAIMNGYNIECGCGLNPGELVGIRKIIEDVLYFVLALIILKRPKRKFEIYPN